MDVNWDKYSFQNLFHVLTDPNKAKGVLRHAAEVCNVFYYRFRPNGGIRVMAEDWDTLVILDGCRADLFEAHCSISGSYERKQSRASATPEWVHENFIGQKFHDTVYLNTNPYPQRLIPEGTFHDMIASVDMDWDDELGTVPPQVAFDRLLGVRKKYPNKRVIAHLVQPHYPFIGELGQQIDDSTGRKGEGDVNPWRKLKFGMDDISHERVWEAYGENLDVALEALQEILPELPGKTVISSDHGNLCGDRMWPLPARGYGHPTGLHVRELIEVPWLEIEHGARPDIVSEEPQAASEDEGANLEGRLEALGYR